MKLETVISKFVVLKRELEVKNELLAELTDCNVQLYLQHPDNLSGVMLHFYNEEQNYHITTEKELKEIMEYFKKYGYKKWYEEQFAEGLMQ